MLKRLSFTLDGEFTGLNEYISAMNRSKYIGNKIKQSETERVAWACKKLAPLSSDFPFVIEATWYVKDLKKDQDNITSAKKFILDGMVLARVLKNDSRKHVRIWKDMDVLVDSSHPRVEITVLEVI